MWEVMDEMDIRIAQTNPWSLIYQLYLEFIFLSIYTAYVLWFFALVSFFNQVILLINIYIYIYISKYYDDP